MYKKTGDMSLTWIKAILGWFPLLSIIPSEVAVPMKNCDLINNDMDLHQPTNQYQWMIDHRNPGYPKIFIFIPWNVHGENHV